MLATVAPETVKRGTRTPLLGIAAFAAVLLVLCRVGIIFAQHPLHDQSWLMLAAERMLGGAALYGPQITEPNPPFAIWFSALPVLLARLLHLSSTVSFRLLVLAMVAASVGWIYRLCRREPRTAALAFATLFSLAVLFVECNTDFGQREQLMLLCVMPYVVARASGAAGRLGWGERVFLGVVGGLAICFKPQYALVIVILELFLLLWHRRLRSLASPEVVALVVTGVLYVAAVYTLAPRYVHETVPLLVQTYWAYATASTLGMILSLRLYLVLVAVLALLCWVGRRRLTAPGLTLGLLAASVGASLAYDVQHTRWPDHAFPYKAFLLLTMACLLLDVAAPYFRPGRLSRRGAQAATGAVAVFILLVGAAVVHQRHQLFDIPWADPAMAALMAAQTPGTAVDVMSTRIDAFPEAYANGLIWGARYGHLWMLPAIVRSEPHTPAWPAPSTRLAPDAVARLASLQRGQTAEDFARWKPSLILVEQCTVARPCLGLPARNFDMAGWFAQGPAFAREWAHYRQVPSAVPGYDQYTRVD